MAKLRKCRWCGQPVSPNASSCPSCGRGLTEWPIHNITVACHSCGTPILVHTAWARGYHGPTQTNVTISGNTGTISHSGAAEWAWPRDCPKCADPYPLRAATRRWWLSLPLWFCVIWMFGRMFQFQNYMKTHHNAPGQAVTASTLLLSVYAVPVLVFILMKLRRHFTRQSVFRRARALDPKPLLISGYAAFAVCLLIRKRVRKAQPLTVSVPASEATR